MAYKKLTKAVIPVAGLGTRFLPATKAIPKEMLTVVDKPLIQYIVHEAAEAGITDIILVTHSSKGAIENHFDKHYELENELEVRGKEDRMIPLKEITPKGVRIVSVRQPEALGLGHAILCASPIIADNEPFAVLLPDVLMYHPKKGCLAQMAEQYRKMHTSVVALEAVPDDQVEKYGIAAVKGPDLRIVELVEKPKPAEAPSNLSVVGRYIFTPRVMEILKTTKPGAGGEIQLTDAMDELLGEEVMFGFEFKNGKTYDCGDKLGYLQANVEYALRDKKLGGDFKKYLKTLELK
ncbi:MULTISPECIES: UTP--glucose-1-phosphate uridylyltransferase GalU [Piscirickettsiaceae]|jgi:UTP--glucose-1-phosphate uridylyltransferase|uniref:UTP--glucose-1-phosphate uridylyltransferase n=1 Tax=Hydrogenovibrio thermophilus TaxID=265883 RepID=A0A410H1Q2_9GAMM|nr:MULTISPECIES: UTP--glucose-1-phosphate uridylyltransferase GalU [Piscirickettsiaceae]AZR82600.1 UTP--glucose-1-phosphate uridylyltransferase [Thiomicrospira sp. S5]QAB14837.1 UTP--glucose-1-phosphate uridylyltransferase GalU [Hydrogenovibrio thermophilus]